MRLDTFLNKLHDTPEAISFDETMAMIDANYEYTPTSFTNGEVRNEAGQNAGSCKVLAFGQLEQLSKEQTLACFGAYYRDEVLGDPDGNNHQNIRNFMRHGWDGVKFDGVALRKKQG